MQSFIVRHGLVLAAAFAAVSALGCGADPTDHDDDAGDDASSRADASEAGAALTGPEIAARRGCNACHQSSGAADGVLSGQTQPRPIPMTVAYGSNLTPHATGLGARTEAEIVRSIREGVRPDGRTLCRVMPRYSTTSISEADMHTLAQYLMGLAPVDRVIPATTVCPPAAGAGR